ncbi:hypothetical protein D9M68_48950 [compost metagenome]|uniref:Uncharacterized protein n=2 Tax=Pseudomonas TaxID=286 RepID=A0A1H4LZE7_PSEJE|nr:hypothetical protein SAMN04490187_1876 [Pseudomonas jessenii]VVQ07738.1 hypothetical protein PS922_04354 [Pseudomonas fluorescens]
MDVNDNAFILDERGALETIASKLAPTGLVGVRKICKHPKKLWERACSRWGLVSTKVFQACLGVLRFIDRTANAVAVSSSIGSENRNVAPRPGTSIN